MLINGILLNPTRSAYLFRFGERLRLEANQTQLELDQFGCVGTWCCDKIKCEGTKSTAANYEPVSWRAKKK